MDLAVIESRWWAGRNTSVKGSYDLLSDLYYNNHHGYNYEMCNSSESFLEAINRYTVKSPETQFISINTHGGEDGCLLLYNGDKITRAKLVNALKKGDEQRSLCGVHFGACFVGTQRLAEYILSHDVSPWWIAGYSTEVSFVESTALDFMFFKLLIERRRKNPIRAIKEVAKILHRQMGGLCDELGFSIFLCEEADGPVQNIITS